MLTRPDHNPPIKRETPEFKALLSTFGDREWRMQNLYTVINEYGERVPYVRRPAQEKYSSEAWFLDVIVKARQLGFSTEIAVDICDACVFNKNFSAGIIDWTLDDAKLKLKKIKTAYHGLPQHIKDIVYLTKDNEAEIWFSNGSSVEVGTSHRGGTLQYLHISEFGKIAAEKPDLAREIITGGMRTVAPGMRIKVESTAHGTHGAFYDIVRRAEAAQLERRELTPIEFRLHFFAWWMDPKYRVQSSLVTVSQELKKYFEELEVNHGIKLDLEQRAWYAQTHADLGEDDMHSEFPSHMGETFMNSTEGTFFKAEMTKARKEGRVGQMVPHDTTRPVHTMWDKGMNELSDQNAIIFFQTDGLRFRFINYYENAGEGIQHYCAKVKEIARECSYDLETHYGPHDLDQRQYGNEAKTVVEIAAENGIKFEIVPRVIDKQDSIEAARRMLNLTWICQEKCARLVECIDNYRKTWNKLLGQWTSKPRHDWASNACDALQTGAVGVKPEKIPQAARANSKPRARGSQWSR